MKCPDCGNTMRKIGEYGEIMLYACTMCPRTSKCIHTDKPESG